MSHYILPVLELTKEPCHAHSIVDVGYSLFLSLIG